MSKKVLIAVGNKSYTQILKDTFKKHREDFLLSSQEVYHRRYLEELLDIEKPDILLIHDTYLDSEHTDQEAKEKELLNFIRIARIHYDDALRIVLLCERPKGDPFLAKAVGIGIMDIFNTNVFDLDEFVDQLLDKPRFSRVEKFLVSNSILNFDEEYVEKKPVEIKEEPKIEKEQPIVQKVIEKKVIQKVVNKNVIKRDFNIQIHNHSQPEKVIGVPIRKKLILVGSAVSRSGSTFISHLLAKSVAQLEVGTTYIENPFSKPYTFDRFYGHEHFDDYRSKFKFYLEPEDNEHYEWEKDGVELICKHPLERIYQQRDVPFEALIKILHASQTVTIIDVGASWQHELFKDLLDIADHVYVVIEPDIPLIQHLEDSKEEAVLYLRKILESEKSAVIGNRFGDYIYNHLLLKDLYKDKLITTFPSYPVEDVFKAQFDGHFLNTTKIHAESISDYVEPLLHDILPAEFFKKQKKKGPGLFKGLFSKKITIEKSETREEQKQL